MNISWRTKRQLMYLAIPIIPTLLIGSFLVFNHFTTATCTDGKINQGERGIDCEGPCPQICEARILPPEIIWSEAFPTLPGVYNLAAKVQNRNDDLAVADAVGQFEVLDIEGNVIYQDQVLVDLNPSSTVVPFIGTVAIDGVPETTRFSFDFSGTEWQQVIESDNIDPVAVRSSVISGSKTEPRASADVSNTTRQNFRDLAVAVTVSSEDGDVVAVSNTVIDLAAGESTELIYTWPRAFPTTEAICQQPVDLVVAIDASGSMNSLSNDPPEPLTSVKTAAKRFAGLFSGQDRLGVVSFANTAQTVQSPTTDLESRVSGIDSVIITAEAEVGYTNMSAALDEALALLNRVATPGRGQAIALLTDGLPTAPDGAPDPEVAAINAASNIQQSGIELFAIGLGEGVNEVFLNRLLSGDRSRVFKTSNADELSVIYSQIASAVCERSPYQIEVFPNPPIY